MIVCLYKSRSWVSSLIRWQTRSQYSHASIMVDNDTVIESVEGKGVQYHKLTPKEIECIDFYTIDVTESEERKIIEFLRSKVGAKYDYLSVFRFISRRKESKSSEERWFCSELFFAAFRYANVILLERVEAWAVSPGLLSMSPLLKKVKYVR